MFLNIHLRKITNYLIFILLLSLSACNQVRPTAVPTNTASPAPTATETAVLTSTIPPTAEVPLRYLALGDSYTIGESVPENERWPVQLVNALRTQGAAVENAEIIAQTGWTTDELADAIIAADPQGPYDLVSLLIGVNNQYRGRSQDEYREQFVDLLEQAIVFADGDPAKVFVVSIPDWGVTPFAARQDAQAIGAEIDAFNAINREESEKAGVAYIDITLISRRALAEPELIAGDGLHPSGKMYTEWVGLIEPIVTDILRDKEIGD